MFLFLVTARRLLILWLWFSTTVHVAQKKEVTFSPNVLTFHLRKEVFLFIIHVHCIVLTGSTGCYPDALEPELMSALQNVSEVVCRFVDNNPTAWAPLICQVIHVFTCNTLYWYSSFLSDQWLLFLFSCLCFFVFLCFFFFSVCVIRSGCEA